MHSGPTLSAFDAMLRMGLALVLGGMIGAERERGGHAAGVRTHSVVCLGAALFTLVSAYGLPEFNNLTSVRYDPFRVAAQIVSGIGFLGAGAIFMHRRIVHGLTTAAGLWMVAGIGMAAGAGMYFVGVASTVLGLAVLALVKLFERRLFPSRQRIEVQLAGSEGVLDLLRARFEAWGGRVQEVEVVYEKGNDRVVLHGSAPIALRPDTLLAELRDAGNLISFSAHLPVIPEGEGEGNGERDRG